MRIRRLLLLLAFPLSLSVQAASPTAAPGAGAQGVPFDRLQQQIDRLRERLEALENQRPAGQSCPSGQFVTGFNSAGTILCNGTSGGTPTPPPPPVQIPPAFLTALQQAILGLAGQFPLQAPPQVLQDGVTTITTQVLSYDATIGAITFSRPNAATLRIQAVVPTFAIDASYSASTLGATIASGVATLAAVNSVVTLDVSIVDGAPGLHRLGAVTSANVALGPTSVSGVGGLAALASTLVSFLNNQIEALIAPPMAAAVNQVLPTLPDF